MGRPSVWPYHWPWDDRFDDAFEAIAVASPYQYVKAKDAIAARLYDLGLDTGQPSADVLLAIMVAMAGEVAL